MKQTNRAAALLISLMTGACATLPSSLTAAAPAMTAPLAQTAAKAPAAQPTVTKKALPAKPAVVAATETKAVFQDLGIKPTAAEQTDAETFFTQALVQAADASPGSDDATPATPAPSSFLVDPTARENETKLLIDDTEIFPELIESLKAAQTRIQIDIYLLGGDIGMTIAKVLAERAEAGVDVKVMLDPKLGLGGPTVDGIRKVVNFLRLSKVGMKFYPLALFGKMVNKLQDRLQIDHNKIVVIDGNTAFMGGMNFDDLARPNRDLTLKFTGPTAVELSAMLDAEWTIGKDPASVLKTKATGLIRLAQTAPQQRNNKELVLSEIAGAKRSIHVTMYEFGDAEIAKALAAAYQRGIDVRVMLDPKGDRLKKYGVGALPNGIPNVMPARELLKVGAQVRWFKPWRVNQELHMKAMVVDGTRLVAGSTNWTPNAFRNFRETSFVCAGPAADKYEAMFQEMWTSRSTACDKLSVKQQMLARLTDYLNNHNLAFW
ncbi:MAG: phosphatidylserine/phosphatidylglycerophosphate/cardiolipin synthase family protein [Candidatus Sericytochromatia bacterium]|nr:phosphatidylserine/phosphatidylglycerophosphate/cardiolipin synthase family protein [Candidatus Sericytochromatia bacterium]